MPTISYAITACNEHEELERLLNQLDKHIDASDEIIVQLDNKRTNEVLEVANKFNMGSRYEYHRIHFDLNNDFATFKNNLMQHCTRDYIFFIDADEYLDDNLFFYLKQMLELNPKTDIFNVPRVNTVDGLTQEHITKWLWRVDEYGRVNYPDYQTRICKKSKNIVWDGNVHERLILLQGGYISYLPEGMDLHHPKTIERQEKQNAYYDTL